MRIRRNLIIVALVIFVSVFGLSYAFFNYYRISENNLQLITGEIYLFLNDGTEELLLTNAFPETVEEARSRDDNFVTFTITGKNTTTDRDIYYEIMLNEGDEVDGRNRLSPEHLRFDLIETIDGVENYVISDKSFADFDARRIWVNTVNRNTTEETQIIYKLRMWISEDILISDTDPELTYTTGEYKNSYASIKFSVFGDFNYKEVSTDTACFAYQDAYDRALYYYDYDGETRVYSLNTSEEAVNACKNLVLSLRNNQDYSDAQDGYQSLCEGTGTIGGQPLRSFAASYVDSFVDNNILVPAENVQSIGIEITNYDIDCGTDVIIPSQIDGKTVVGISDKKSGTPVTQLSSNKSVQGNTLDNNLNNEYSIQPMYLANGVFSNSGITSVKFPKTLKYIGFQAFSGDLIKEVIIPDSVTEISGEVFWNNPLVNVQILSNSTLGIASFVSYYDDNVNHFEKFTYGGTCQELNQYQKAFTYEETETFIPTSIITSDSNSCTIGS